jgi:hypothetical protein
MILFATPQATPPQITVRVPVEQGSSHDVFQVDDSGDSASAFGLTAPAGDVMAGQAKAQEVPEEFDWQRPKVLRQYVRLEQKVLAGMADDEELRVYSSMKTDRNSKIFADRYVSDYAEIQRLKALAEKLTEIQKYLRPIRI